MTRLYVIAVGFAKSEKGVKLPTKADLGAAWKLAKKHELELTFFAIDPRLSATDPEVAVLADSFKDSFVLGTELMNEFVVPKGEIEDFRTTEDPVIYLDHSNPTIADEPDFLNMLERTRDYKQENRWHFRVTGQPSIKELVAEYVGEEGRFANPPYNPFSGDPLPDYLSDEERVLYHHLILKWTKFAVQYMTAGFYQRDDDSALPEDWAMNLYHLEMQAFIQYYGLLPTEPDKELNREFASNSQYRQIVTKVLVRVLANFYISNRILKAKRVQEFPSNWRNAETYKYALEKLTKMLFEEPEEE
jgi:hypothetical protein